ncbi:hypothetical protein DIPPA_19970 [Diplonema papillatum]|nr:hypothetical protein DIPPA_19970 [Diplonema papillatum]
MSVTDIEHRLLEHLQGRTAIPDGMFNDYISYLDGQVQRSREAREHWTALRGKKETRKKKKKTPAGGGGYADPRTEGYFRRISRFYEKHDPKMVAGVDVLLETYCGREEAFLAKLVERYGPEPEDAEEAGGLALSLTVGKSAGDLAPKSPRYELNRTVSEFAETKRDRFGFEVEDEPLFAQLEARRTSSPVAAAHEAVREFLRARFDTANLVEDMSEKLDDAGDDAEDLRQRLTEAITAAGVPEEERPSVWFAVTGAFRAREAAEQPSFADAGTRTAPAESLATIKKDMGRTFDTANLVEDMSEKLDDAGDDAEDLRQRLTEAITAAGVPEEERPSVWFAVTGAFRAREAAEQPSFADAGTRTAPAESLATIKKDMGRTFPMCDAFDEGRLARKELHGVLSAFAPISHA